ncbi:hypothetical protein DS830_02770 [Bombilactobacillus bombi]|uniref:Uncharacterized protein n=1 Tax=Bombilactobacillus bombi TaxID=1303590 RepID=A0A347SQZ5_9LACO|nr:hypothetical protein [Bombilactobacillus bombi]AXX64454.1 hypothetical protein DS830_02770 [Bombilactobacillus bombi]MCO6541231.1 hypothetical protein [Lactobacillus sp.]RHW46013.1 hypothetical protein DS832_06575 [Bombilactobacillus bombi]
MKIIYNYVQTFNKIIWSEKIPFIYTLFLPAVFYIFSNFHYLSFGKVSLYKLLLSTSNYFAYMVVSVAINGVSLQLISFRESGFLKTFTMISGGERKFPVYGLLISEFLFGYMCIFLFGMFISFFDIKNIIKIVLIYTLIYLFTAFPVMFVSVLLDIFPLRFNTSSVLANLGLFLMIWLSAVRKDTGSFIGELLFGINPADYVTQVASLIINFFQYHNFVNMYQLLSVLSLFVIYCIVGYIVSSKIKINSLLMRN